MKGHREIQIEQAVKTYALKENAGHYICRMEHILLLHGALGSKVQLYPLEERLKDSFTVHNLNLPGHGGEAIPTTGFSIESFSKYVMAYLDEKKIERITIFGYSMGGYVAMYFAATFPARVNRVITLGTKFLWDEAIAANEVKMLDTDTIIKKVPAFAEELHTRHQPTDWKLVAEKTKEMLLRMGIHSPLQLAHYHAVKVPCLLLVGDRDKTVSPGETLAVYKQLGDGQLGIIPLSLHAVDKTNINTVAYMVMQFCTSP